ncbi:MAG: hypothetical protein AAB152_16775 [Candidatus Coatesbacteria bacterium]
MAPAPGTSSAVGTAAPSTGARLAGLAFGRFRAPLAQEPACACLRASVPALA